MPKPWIALLAVILTIAICLVAFRMRARFLPAPASASGQAGTEGEILRGYTASTSPLATVAFDSKIPAPSIEEQRFIAALAVDAKLANADERQTARLNTLVAWSETDPRHAFLYWQAHGSGEATDYLRELLFRRWADDDFMGAIDYAERQSSGNTHEEMMGGLTLALARLSPSGAATMIDQDMTSGPVRTETAASVVHMWALRDIKGASNWAATLPRGPLRDRVLNEVTAFAETTGPSSNSE